MIAKLKAIPGNITSSSEEGELLVTLAGSRGRTQVSLDLLGNREEGRRIAVNEKASRSESNRCST